MYLKWLKLVQDQKFMNVLFSSCSLQSMLFHAPLCVHTRYFPAKLDQRCLNQSLHFHINTEWFNPGCYTSTVVPTKARTTSTSKLSIYILLFWLNLRFLFAEVVCQVKPRRRGDNKNQLPDLHRYSSSGHQHEWLQEGMHRFQQHSSGFLVFVLSWLCETHFDSECLLFRLWGRSERVTEQEKDEQKWRLGMHLRTCCLPKLPHTLVTQPPTDLRLQ